jgi:hypothetical protein
MGRRAPKPVRQKSFRPVLAAAFPRAAALTVPPAGSRPVERAMSVNNTVLAFAAILAFAASVYVAARPETQTVSFAMPMTQKIYSPRR